MKRLSLICLYAALAVGCLFAVSPSKRSIASGSSTTQESRRLVTRYALTPTKSHIAGGHGINISGLSSRARLRLSSPSAAPSRISTTGASVYGNLSYDAGGIRPKGIYEVFPQGQLSVFCELPTVGIIGSNCVLEVNNAYIREGQIYGFATEIMETIFGNFLIGNHFVVYDPDGTMSSYVTLAENAIKYDFLCYDPVDDMVYGYIMSKNGTFFCTSPGATPNDITPVSQVSGVDNLAALTYNVVSRKIIGITNADSGGDVLEINPADGTATTVAKLSDPSEFVTGICYSPMDSKYIYAVCTEEHSAIQTLDPETFNVISSVDCGNIEFTNLFCTDDRKIDLGAPGEPTLVGSYFVEGATDGTITFSLASKTFGGTSVLGNIDWALHVDGKENLRGSAKAGSNIDANVSGLSTDMHQFEISCSLGGKKGRSLKFEMYIGNDTPLAPTEVKLASDKIEWTPVNAGIHGGFVNPDKVTYNVYLNNNLIAEDISGNSCATRIPEGEHITHYEAAVEAVFDGRISTRTSSNKINYGDPFKLPVFFEPTYDESGLFTVVNANDDLSTILYDTSMLNGEPVTCFYYEYNPSNDGDDWLFLPPLALDNADAVYNFTFNAFRQTGYDESFEVKLCSAADPSAVVSTIIGKTYVDNERIENDETLQAALNHNYTKAFTISEPGTYYIGIHATSPADQYRLFLRNFSVSKFDGMTGANPQQATQVGASAGLYGKLEASVMFIFPTANIAGAAYAPDMILKASVQAEGCGAVEVSGKPGEVMTLIVPTKQGDNVISVTVNDNGLPSVPATTKVYTGVERPGAPTNAKFTVDPTGYKARFTWSAPDQGQNGGYVEPTGITYYLCHLEDTGWVIGEQIGTDVFSYDYEIPQSSKQQIHRLGVIASNFVGTGDYFAIGAGVMGESLPLPNTINCKAGQVPDPLVTYTSGLYMFLGNPQDRYCDYGSDDQAYALYTYSENDLTDAEFSLPTFSTHDTSNPAVKLDIYGGSTSSFSVWAHTYGISKKLKTFAADDFAEKGPQTVKLDLGEEFKDKDWVEVRILSNTSSSETFILYRCSFYDNVDYDFGVTSIEGPSKAKIGEENKYTVHIANYGNNANPVPASRWQLVDSDGTMLADVDIPQSEENIEPEMSTSFDLSFTPNADQAGSYTLSFELDRSDSRVSNDRMAKKIEVIKGLQPVVTDLSASEISGDKVVLSWSPVVVNNAHVEGFENETPLILDSEMESVAGFRRVDGDNQPVYGANNPNYKQLETAFKPQSFVVWSTAEMSNVMGEASTYSALSGDKFLIAFCPGTGNKPEPAADDWLISPEVAPGTDISFSLRPITYEYGAETVEVMYSTSSDNPEDFRLLKKIELSGNVGDRTSWEDFNLTLPHDARYFAIHYVSQDIFGIMVDDIAYTPVTDAIDIKGFDIYRDGRLICPEAACPDNSYADTTVGEYTEYYYSVVPVLSNGSKGLDSNTLVVRTSGISVISASDKSIFNIGRVVTVTGYAGERITVISVDGRVIMDTESASRYEQIHVPSGVILIHAGNDIVKLIIK